MDDRVALADGTRIAEYCVVQQLGRGGFGITYRAVDQRNGSEVALKEFFPLDIKAMNGSAQCRVIRVPGEPTLQCTDPSLFPDYRRGLERVLQEAKTLLLFRHPNIVQVKRLLRENNTLYLVLTLEEGINLREWVRRMGRPPSQAEFDRALPALLNALAVIHRNNLLHRDIAPDNIFRRPSGDLSLLDFGSARPFEGRDAHGLTRVVKGGFSPHEQYYQDSSHQGPWTDIYALAATLYSVIQGTPPPEGRDRYLEWRARRVDTYRPLRSLGLSGYRGSFLQAVDWALELETRRRPKTAKEWQQALLSNDFETPPPQRQQYEDAPQTPRFDEPEPEPRRRTKFLSKFADLFR